MNVTIKKVAAGKLRRYAGFGLLDYLRHFDIVLNNIVDFFKTIAGFFQSFFRLLFKRPDAIFLKGGYVCLPVGIAARLLHIPYVIHDSDATPGLTNRLLAKKAAKIATGMPLSYYSYPEHKAEWTGIPINEEFRPVSERKQRSLKKELGFDPEKKLVLATGGSLGAEDINLTMREMPGGTLFPDKLMQYDDFVIREVLHNAITLEKGFGNVGGGTRALSGNDGFERLRNLGRWRIKVEFSHD